MVVGATEGIPRHADSITDVGTRDASGPPLTLHVGLVDGTCDGNHGHARTVVALPGHARTETILDSDLSNLAALDDLEMQRPDSSDEQRALATITEGMASQEALAFARLKSFCSNIVKKLAPPLLKEVQAATLRP